MVGGDLVGEHVPTGLRCGDGGGGGCRKGGWTAQRVKHWAGRGMGAWGVRLPLKMREGWLDGKRGK